MPNQPENDDILKRAQVGREALAATVEPMFMLYLAVTLCLSGLIAACFCELFSMTVAIDAQFPPTSDGSSLADTVMPMRYYIPVYLLLGHVLVRAFCDRLGRRINGLVDMFGILPIILMMGAMMVFMFSSTAQTTGGDEQGTLAAMAGPALGAICASLAAVSFLAAHALAGKLLEALKGLIAGRKLRSQITDIDRELEAEQVLRTRMAVCQRNIDLKQQPDVLKRKAAVEAAAIVAPFAAEAHELHASREMRGPAELRDIDIADVPDSVSLEVLDRLRTALAGYTTTHFFNILKSEA